MGSHAFCVRRQAKSHHDTEGLEQSGWRCPAGKMTITVSRERVSKLRESLIVKTSQQPNFQDATDSGARSK